MFHAFDVNLKADVTHSVADKMHEFFALTV